MNFIDYNNNLIIESDKGCLLSPTFSQSGSKYYIYTKDLIEGYSRSEGWVYNKFPHLLVKQGNRSYIQVIHAIEVISNIDKKTPSDVAYADYLIAFLNSMQTQSLTNKTGNKKEESVTTNEENTSVESADDRFYPFPSASHVKIGADCYSDQTFFPSGKNIGLNQLILRKNATPKGEKNAYAFGGDIKYNYSVRIFYSQKRYMTAYYLDLDKALQDYKRLDPFVNPKTKISDDQPIIEID